MNREAASRQEQQVLATADALDREARRVVDVPPDADLVLVPQYARMSRSDAIRFRFGTDQVPAGLIAVLLTNASPPDGVPYDWWALDRGSIEFKAAAERCRAEALGLARVGL
jgi:hypothetical protein